LCVCVYYSAVIGSLDLHDDRPTGSQIQHCYVKCHPEGRKNSRFNELENRVLGRVDSSKDPARLAVYFFEQK